MTRRFQESPGLRALAEMGKQMQARQDQWAAQANSLSRAIGQIQKFPDLRAIAEAALQADGLFTTAQLAEHVAEDLLVEGPGLVPRYQLSDLEWLALQRAVIFIAVGMLVILAMELAPEATAHFGIWFGITGGLTTLLWILMETRNR